MEQKLVQKIIRTDVLIIGGGTAGCYAALTLARNSKKKILIVEKADIKRSGCLAAGVNAINAYITPGNQPEDYVDYATRDAKGIARRDLLLTAAREFNTITSDLEQLGLVILKDDNGNYVTRGNRNIKINGENIKPILADSLKAYENIEVINRVNITDLLVHDQTVHGAVGFSIEELKSYIVYAEDVIVATGGASGLYRPNNPGFSRHKMWYPPFNTGAGYAMGIRSGAEMTSFEMRFIALRCKDTIAPTGTIAQGVQAKQVNSRGEIYETKYGITTTERVYGTVRENLDGNGPCYLQTSTMGAEKNEDLLKAYLNMAPSQTLRWIESGKKPSEQDVEITGTEPYIVGGHTASGFWVDTKRETTIHHLYAAGDVAGGCPQKYVTGALAEGKIAALAILEREDDSQQNKQEYDFDPESIIRRYENYLRDGQSFFSTEDLEEAMQKIMDEYAGGISASYQFNEKQLQTAESMIFTLVTQSEYLKAENMQELMYIYELKERLTVCQSLIAHMRARKETRWHTFHENLDYPQESEAFYCYVNSCYTDAGIRSFTRGLVTEEYYEHQNQ